MGGGGSVIGVASSSRTHLSEGNAEYLASRVVNLYIDLAIIRPRGGCQQEHVRDGVSVVRPKLPPSADAIEPDMSVPALVVGPHVANCLKIQSGHVKHPLLVFCFLVNQFCMCCSLELVNWFTGSSEKFNGFCLNRTGDQGYREGAVPLDSIPLAWKIHDALAGADQAVGIV
jgi:hypothetical protein